jgi:hypothetical protein
MRIDPRVLFSSGYHLRVRQRPLSYLGVTDDAAQSPQRVQVVVSPPYLTTGLVRASRRLLIQLLSGLKHTLICPSSGDSARDRQPFFGRKCSHEENLRVVFGIRTWI